MKLLRRLQPSTKVHLYWQGAYVISSLVLDAQGQTDSDWQRRMFEVGESVNGKGSLLLADFSKKDRLKVGDDTLKLKDIKAGDAPSFIDLG